MAEIKGLLSNNQLNQQLQTLESLFANLSPPSRFRNRPQFSPAPASPSLSRGRMYQAYASLRESKLLQRKAEAEAKETPRKRISFLNAPLSERAHFSVAQSVPDFSASLRKENKKPNSSAAAAAAPKGVGCWSKSASVGDKRSPARKSCASLKELRGLSAAAASAIEEEGRGGRNRVVKKIALGQRPVE